MKHFKNFFFKTFTILVIILFTTSCTTPWVDDFQLDYALKTLAVGGGAAATFGIGYGIYYLVADLPEKAQKEYTKINEQIENANTLSEISKAIEKAKKYDEKSNYFDYTSLVTTANNKLQSLNLPYQVKNGTLQFNITYLLQKCNSLSDIENLIANIKEYDSENSLPTVVNEINNYMYNKNIPYIFDLNTQSLLATDSIQELLENIKNESVNNDNLSILLDWIKGNSSILKNKELVSNYILSTLDEIIKNNIYKQPISATIDTAYINQKNLATIYSNYKDIFDTYLSMDEEEFKNYIIEQAQFFVEEKCYNDAIYEENPYLYIEAYPEGQFDASKIPMSDELKAYLDAKTSLENAKAFREKYPNSKYLEDVELYINQEEEKIQEEKLREWQNSNEFRILQSKFETDELTKELYVGQNGYPFTSLGITLNDLLKETDWRPFQINIEQSLWDDELIMKRTVGYEQLEVSIKFEDDKAIFTSASFEALGIYPTYNYQDIALVLGCLFVPAEELNQLIMISNMYEVI